MKSLNFRSFKRSVIILVFFIWPSVSALAQNHINLTLRWNSKSGVYDVYGKPNFTAQDYPIGPTQISIVCPKIVPNKNLRTISYQMGFSQIDSIFEPLAAPQSDFFAFQSFGAKLDFIENVEYLLFSFRFTDNICREGVRIFDNDSDPNYSMPGMSGGDFRNAIYSVMSEELYSTNYDNLGSVCDNCPKEICIPFKLIKNTNND